MNSTLARPAILLLAASLLSACGDEIEGVFEPACIAHAGDRVILKEGRFEWDKFTDEVRLNPAGERIDAYPDYPKKGKFVVGKYQNLVFTSNDGSSLDDHYLLEYRDHWYLLTYEQNEAVLDGEAMPACALRLAEPEGQ